MTAFSTPLAGGMAGGLNALSSPLGGALSAPLLAQLLGRAGAGGMPGSLAPQIPMPPAAPRGAAGPLPQIPPAPQPAALQNSSLLASLGALGKRVGGANSGQPFNWSTNTGLFGGAGPFFGAGALTGALDSATAAPALAGGVGDIGSLFASNPELFALF